jgi:hypothetical protein
LVAIERGPVWAPQLGTRTATLERVEVIYADALAAPFAAAPFGPSATTLTRPLVMTGGRIRRVLLRIAADIKNSPPAALEDREAASDRSAVSAPPHGQEHVEFLRRRRGPAPQRRLLRVLARRDARVRRRGYPSKYIGNS